MSKEYIEREAVVNLREEFWKDRCDYMAVRVTNIMNIPAADVSPVVHGEWIKISYTTLYKCSNCTDMTDMPYQKNLFKYCPNCGAYMRGGNSNER